MSQRRSMPTKKAIAKHWGYEDDYCWGCGFNTQYLDRAHIKARVSGGSDEEDNLVLLCRFCHSEIQEPMCTTDEGIVRFLEGIEDGLPFFNIRMGFMMSKFKAGLYDNIVLEMGYKSQDISNLKKINITF